MINNHPITPPPELVKEWLEDSPEDDELGIAGHIATQAARWGADQELEACCKLLDGADIVPPDGAKTYPENLFAARERMGKLRSMRRPKPSSLKVQALEALNRGLFGVAGDADTIRRALEQLDG